MIHFHLPACSVRTLLRNDVLTLVRGSLRPNVGDQVLVVTHPDEGETKVQTDARVIYVNNEVFIVETIKGGVHVG